MMHASFKVTEFGHSAWIQMQSIDGLPRLSQSTLYDLDRILRLLKWNGCDRLVLTADFDSSRIANFCAGADLREVANLEPLTALEFASLGQHVIEQLLWPGWKTLVVMSGVVMGGGCDLALHGQERWAVEGTNLPLKFHHPAAIHGLITGFGGTYRLKELLGKANALKLFIDLEVWDGMTCRKAGLINKLLTEEEFKPAIQMWLSSEK